MKDSKTRLIAAFCGVASFIVVGVLCPRTIAQEFKTVHDGVEYAEMMRTIDGQPVRINLLRLDLAKVRLDVVHAGNNVIGTAKTSVIAANHGAVAGINAGFFRLDTSAFAGDPAGIFQIDGKLLSESTKGRVALEIINDTTHCQSCSVPKNQTLVTIEHLNTFAEFWTQQNRFNISGIDRELKENDAVLYSPEFGATSPPSAAKILEIVIENKKIKSAAETNGGTPIPPNGFVLSAAGAKKGGIKSCCESRKRSDNDPWLLFGSRAEFKCANEIH